jgi:hypothetical protein
MPPLSLVPFKKRKASSSYGNAYTEKRKKPTRELKNHLIITSTLENTHICENIRFIQKPGSSEIFQGSENYLLQIPGSDAVPVIRQTGRPEYSDRLTRQVWVEYLRLYFTLDWDCFTTVRVVAY